MLTPIELQGKVFKTGFGYDKKDVEAFLKEVVSNYETLYKENLELNDKIGVLSEGVQYYKSIEKTLQKALVLAEKTAQETEASAVKRADALVDDATKKADLITQEAYTKADSITKNALHDAKLMQIDARKNLDQMRLQISTLVQQYEHFKIQYKQLLNAQAEFLESKSIQINYTALKEQITQSESTPVAATELNDAKEPSEESTESYNDQEINDHSNYVIREITPEDAQINTADAKQVEISHHTEKQTTNEPSVTEESHPVMDDTFIPTIDLAGILEEAKKQSEEEEAVAKVDASNNTASPKEEEHTIEPQVAKNVGEENTDYDYVSPKKEDISEQDLLQQLFSVNPKKKNGKKNASNLSDDFEFLDL